MRLDRILAGAWFIFLMLGPAAPVACAAADPASNGYVIAFQQVPAAGLKGWDTIGGDWTAADGRLLVRNPDTERNAVALPRKAPLLETQTVGATVAVRERLAAAGWSLAGVMIYAGPQDFWLLCLTQDEGGRRYVDFLEYTHGAWQAQTAEGPTKLAAGPEGGSRAPWVPNHDYRLRLDLAGDSIAASVNDGTTGEVIATGRYSFGNAQAVRMGTVGLLARGCAAGFGDVLVKAPAAALEAPSGIQVEKGRLGSIALLRDALPDLDLATVDSLAARLRAAGFGVTFLSAENVTNPAVLDPLRFSLYAIPNAGVYPADGTRALMAFLRRGGHLLLLGGPPFSRPVWRRNGEWIDLETVRSRIAKTPPAHGFLDFAPGQDPAGWTRATNDPDIRSSITIDPAGPEARGAALKVSMADLTGWNTYASPSMEGAIPEGQELVTLWAKGDAKTSQLSVEMDETDGSRWIAVTPLTTTWTYHVLSPEDFKFWADSRTRGERGGAGDRFHPHSATRVIVGLAGSHTHQVGPGPHVFWVARFGSAANPYDGLTTSLKQESFPLETATPSYKLYPLREVASLAAAPDQTVVPAGLRLDAPGPAFSCIARPMGKGYGNDPHWRWIPLIRAMDAGGQRRGTAAWMLLNESLPFRGSIVTVFGLQDQSLYRGEALGSAVVDAARQMEQGIFLAEAGSREFCYWPGEKVELGARVENEGRVTAPLRVRFTVAAKDSDQKPFEGEQGFDLDAGETKSVAMTWDPGIRTGDCRVVTELVQGGQVIDRISHEIGFLPATKPARDNFVTVKGSDFMLNGRKWNPVGVNFWPLYVSGLEPGEYSGHWLSRGFYDPDEIEEDLQRVASLGMNMVSVQLGGADASRNTLDFLRRCGRHGIKVNGFLAGASPLDFNEAEARSVIRAGRLEENPTLFAYDTIWEPGNSVFNAQGRQRWDRDWEAWIADRYGSPGAAETDWGMPVPKVDGRVSSPSDQQLSQDGPWRVMVAAYRRFMDDLISRKWNDATRRLRAMDPNHLISFRQGNTLPQDFAFTGPVKHIDFISPEGYSIPPGEKGDHAAGFTNRYVHFTTGGKPIFWAEFGQSVWDGDRMQPDSAAFSWQADYMELFYRQALAAGANGLAPWWWPGGYRVDERSDFGIMNLDGTPRPAAEVVARYASRLKEPREYPVPDTWLTIDRDAHPGGYWWIVFHEGSEAYARAQAAGRHLGVRTAGTGANSATTPLVAVGNRPYNGHNPLKFLNAEFNRLQVQDRNGNWVDVTNGTVIPVTSGKPVHARAAIGNTQEATWLTPASAEGRPGAVYLAAAEGSAFKVRQPIPRDTPFLSDADLGTFDLTPGVTAPTRVVLQMTADRRGWFGEKREFSLMP